MQDTILSDARADEEGIAWAAEQIGGEVVGRERQGRWRPHWILDIRKPDGVIGRYLLRGHRNPGYTDHDDPRAFLEREAGVLAALQPLGLKVPRYYGHNRELSWFLMEFIEGDVMLTTMADKDRQFRIYRTYLQELAKLHATPIETIALPDSVEIPDSCADFRQKMIDKSLAFYRALDRKYPEPTLELALQWVMANEPPGDRPVRLGLGDVGPDQFLFRGDEIASLMDFEYATAGDVMMEMGMMRGRDLVYHLGRMPEHLRYYGQCYEALTGTPLDLDALNYWTVAGPTLWQVYTVAGTQNPRGTTTDTAFMFSYEVILKRRVMEGIALHLDLTLEKPDFGTPRSTTLSRLHQVLIDQLRDYYGAAAGTTEAQTFAKYSAAIAETLALGNAHQIKIELDNLAELSELLGETVTDLDRGLFTLEERIRANFREDIERRIAFLYRYECRREFLYRPMQETSGVSHAISLRPV